MAVCADLVGEVLSKEIFLRLLVLQVDFNLIECLLRAEMWLVVHLLELFVIGLAHLLLGDLGLEELAVGLVLLLAILLLEVLHSIHVVKG